MLVESTRSLAFFTAALTWQPEKASSALSPERSQRATPVPGSDKNTVSAVPESAKARTALVPAMLTSGVHAVAGAAAVGSAGVGA